MLHPVTLNPTPCSYDVNIWVLSASILSLIYMLAYFSPSELHVIISWASLEVIQSCHISLNLIDLLELNIGRMKPHSWPAYSITIIQNTLCFPLQYYKAGFVFLHFFCYLVFQTHNRTPHSLCSQHNIFLALFPDTFTCLQQINYKDVESYDQVYHCVLILGTRFLCQFYSHCCSNVQTIYNYGDLNEKGP